MDANPRALCANAKAQQSGNQAPTIFEAALFYEFSPTTDSNQPCALVRTGVSGMS
jgi:hypothetical protein